MGEVGNIDIMQLTPSLNGGRNFGYSAVLSGKNDCGLWSVSIAEQFVSSFLTSTESDITFTPRMHKVSTGANTHQSE